VSLLKQFVNWASDTVEDAGKTLVNIVTTPIRTVVGQNSDFSQAISFEAEDFNNQKWGKAVDVYDDWLGRAEVVAGGAALIKSGAIPNPNVSPNYSATPKPVTQDYSMWVMVIGGLIAFFVLIKTLFD
jgi:hypothetical protein